MLQKSNHDLVNNILMYAWVHSNPCRINDIFTEILFFWAYDLNFGKGVKTIIAVDTSLLQDRGCSIT